jgi:hypothetical protein
MSRQAMKLALEALESDPVSHLGLVHRKLAITALRQALDVNMSEERVDEKVKSEQEPVLWLKTWSDGSVDVLKIKSHLFTDHELEPLYTAPPKKEWVELTDDEIEDIYFDKFSMSELVGFARSIEQALKEKNK